MNQATAAAATSRPLDIEDISSNNLLEDEEKGFNFLSPMEQELVILFTGPRGSLKSLMLAYTSIAEMQNDSSVWSNLPISTGNNYTDIRNLSTNELDIVRLYSLGREIEPGGLYALDEYDKICAARWSSSSNINRVLDWLATQIRKFGTSFLLAAQNFFHIDSMWREQIDVVVFCKDLVHTPWGKKRGLVRGELGFIECYDKSGFVTGYENDPYTNQYAKPFAAHYIQGKPLWGTYNTRKLLGIDEMLRRLRFLKEDVFFGNEGIVENQEPDYQKFARQEDRTRLVKSNYIKSLVGKLIGQGREDITIVEISHLAAKAGMNIRPDEIGQLLHESGIDDWARCVIDYEGRKHRTTRYYLKDYQPAGPQEA